MVASISNVGGYPREFLELLGEDDQIIHIGFKDCDLYLTEKSTNDICYTEKNDPSGTKQGCHETCFRRKSFFRISLRSSYTEVYILYG